MARATTRLLSFLVYNGNKGFLVIVAGNNDVQPNDFVVDKMPGRLHRHPNGYWIFIPDPLPPEITWSIGLVTALSKADRALGELAGLASMLPNPNLLIQPLIRCEAILSSCIEGARASLGDLYAFEAVQLTLFELPKDVKEVQNCVLALQHGMGRLATLPVSLRLMRELHARLLQGVRGESGCQANFAAARTGLDHPAARSRLRLMCPPCI